MRSLSWYTIYFLILWMLSGASTSGIFGYTFQNLAALIYLLLYKVYHRKWWAVVLLASLAAMYNNACKAGTVKKKTVHYNESFNFYFVVHSHWYNVFAIVVLHTWYLISFFIGVWEYIQFRQLNNTIPDLQGFCITNIFKYLLKKLTRRNNAGIVEI